MMEDTFWTDIIDFMQLLKQVYQFVSMCVLGLIKMRSLLTIAVDTVT